MLPFSFTLWQFAAAGAICAAGPVIIHLLNRRRYRVLPWAAMDFLKEAVQRNRRILHLRDILLLVLRTAAILLFGLALSRPFWASSQAQFDSRQPLHAVLVVDNSLSMGYQVLGGDLLAQAKARARDFIDELPAGSKVSVLPACGQSAGYSPDPFDTKEAAREALDRVQVVDRAASFVRAMNEARKACEAVPQLGKRIVFITDAQRQNWRDLQVEELQDLPPVQVVEVASEGRDNAWISNLSLQDGLADIETPSTIVVEVQQRGTKSGVVQVTLSVGDAVIGEKSVDFSTTEEGAGAARQIEFQHVFNALAELPEPERPVFAALKATITSDNLPYDDSRYLIVPIVAALPVVFVDQYGDQEDAARNRLGETRHLRKLLAPKTARADAPKQLVQVRHLRPEQLSRELLADARVVVVAGLNSPGDNVDLLREYVQQGGQLLLAAGANFDPAAWTEEAWLEGAGILPLPLASEPLGDTPEAAGDNLRPFFLSYESLRGEQLFTLPNVSEEELRELYSEPFFFKTVQVETTGEALEKATKAERARLTEKFELLAAVATSKAAAEAKRDQISEEDRRRIQTDEARVKELRPEWLAWNSEAAADETSTDAKERARQVEQRLTAETPRVMARFTSEAGPAFLTEKRIGRGRVVFCATGLQSSWNTLPQSNAVFVFDRLIRGMIRATLPERNLESRERLVLPVPISDRDIRVTLTRPGKETEPEVLDAGFIGAERRGVTLNGLDQRGVYRVTATRADTVAPLGEPKDSLTAEKPLWDVSFAVNGQADESELAPFTRDNFEELTADSPLRWVGENESITLAGEAFYGQSTWWWLALCVLGVLLLEMSILAWPRLTETQLAPAA